MRRMVFLASTAATLGALATLAACATADGQDASPTTFDGGGTSVLDASSSGEVDGTTPRDASAPVWSACNDHGWCETDLPDPNLRFIDVWPFADRAFAVAESDLLGTKVLEWTEATQAWSYVDDNSQNTFESGHYAGKMYAPGENELYFTTAPGMVYHGTRATPSAPFTWESTRLPYDGPTHAGRDPGRSWLVTTPGRQLTRYAAALGVIGASQGDVYAWYGNRIFRRTSEDGGPPTWVSEFVTEDANGAAAESFYIFNASAPSSDEIWFVGGHGPIDATRGFTGCGTLFRRTPSGYSVVMDSTFANSRCTTKPGTIPPIYAFENAGTVLQLPFPPSGWATAVAPVAPGAAVVFVQESPQWYYVDTESGVARANQTSGVSPLVTGGIHPGYLSVARVDDRLWFTGHGLVFSSEIKPEAWNDKSLGIGTPLAGQSGGALLEMTSVAMKDRFLNEPLYQLRGTSKNNIWVVGNRHALHKKTP